MTIPREAIRKALDAGWLVPHTTTADDLALPHNQAVIALDPSFWQSLGKALGWRPDRGLPYDLESKEWFERADHFFLLHMHGQDTKVFWAELLANDKAA